MSRIFISAAHKSSGKTTLSIGICAALTAQGKAVQSFKKGPDYIDPLWLSKATQRPCFNLDFNTMTNREIFSLLISHEKHRDLSLIEANKGLYDGVDVNGSDSNAALAKLLKVPVILVINAQGITRGVAPLLLGYQAFDPTVNIAGVIFNQVVGTRHEKKLRTVTEKYTDIPVLGAVYRNPTLSIEERHLGLMPSNERSNALQQITEIGKLIQNQVDLPRICEIAKTTRPLSFKRSTFFPPKQNKSIRIGICQDPAFAFYYADDLEILQQEGAELVVINTLKDQSLPKIDGLFIGGGFPETQMEKLADNKNLRKNIKQAIKNGLPTYAECGGLMYLSQYIHWQNKTFPMVGVIPANIKMHKRPQGRGYIKLEETTAMLWAGRKAQHIINGHEFHYSNLDLTAETKQKLLEQGSFAYKVRRGFGIDGQHDGWVYKNLLASYAHLRNTENNPWATRFIQFIREKKYDS